MSDVFLNLPVRALGYGFALGEAFMYTFDLGVVDMCYTVGTGFCIVHVVHATLKSTHGDAVTSFLYSFLFEAFASALIPTFTVFWACRFTWKALWNRDIRPHWLKRWLPTAVGVLLIPLMIKPVDEFVIGALDGMFKQ